MSSGNIVKLNIGGNKFEVSKSTLTKFGGMFKTMLESNAPVAKDNSGCIFIDRDPKHFLLILNYMRDGNVDLPNFEKELEEIQKEAQYYRMASLNELCLRKLRKNDVDDLTSKTENLKIGSKLEWNDLPRDLKLKCIMPLDLKTLCCVRCTSRTEKEIVDSLIFEFEEVSFTNNLFKMEGFDNCGNEEIYEFHDIEKIIPFIAYFLKKTFIKKFTLYLWLKQDLKILEALDELIEPQSIRIQFFQSFSLFSETTLFFLQKCWDKVDCIDLRLDGDSGPEIEDCIKFPSVINARDITFDLFGYPADARDVQPLIENWIERDAKIGTQLLLKPYLFYLDQFASNFENRLITHKQFEWVRMRTNNPEKHILAILNRYYSRARLYFTVIPSGLNESEYFDFICVY